jgi:WD40 repeat protein
MPAEGKNRRLPRGFNLRHKLLHQDAIYAIAWSPDGRLLASGSRDHIIRVWDAVTGVLWSRKNGHPVKQPEHIFHIHWG